MTAHPGAERLPAIPAARQTPAQQQASAALIAGPRGQLRGPFIAMLRSPELLERAQRLGEYLRYRSVVPHKLRELAILATSRHWRATYEWHAHAPIALAAGLTQPVIDALAEQRIPEGLASDEQAVLEFCLALHSEHAVGDALYERLLRLLGEAGVVELCGICGYYAMLAMMLNVARTALPAGATVPFDGP